MSRITRELEKKNDHGVAFVQYKSSELGIQKVVKAKNNALKKVYHHSIMTSLLIGRSHVTL